MGDRKKRVFWGESPPGENEIGRNSERKKKPLNVSNFIRNTMARNVSGF